MRYGTWLWRRMRKRRGPPTTQSWKTFPLNYSSFTKVWKMWKKFTGIHEFPDLWWQLHNQVSTFSRPSVSKKWQPRRLKSARHAAKKKTLKYISSKREMHRWVKNFVLIVSVTALKLYKTEQELITFGQVPKTVLVVWNTLLSWKFSSALIAKLLEPAQNFCAKVVQWAKNCYESTSNKTSKINFLRFAEWFSIKLFCHEKKSLK